SLFWLARPIGAMTAFFGKFAAALILVFATTMIVAIPALIVDPGLLEEPLVFLGALGFGVGCIAVGATLGLLLRNRSAWFLATVAVIFGFGAAAWAMAEPFAVSYAFNVVTSFITAIVAVFVAALIVAHGVAFVRGRHDARAQARILTLVLAAILGGALLVAGSFAGWLLGLDVEDFDRAYMRGRAGNALVLETWRLKPMPWGRAFAVDLARGRSIPLETGADATAISPARIFYANRISAGEQRFEILALDLGAEPRTRTTGVVHTGYIASLETPRDGSRVAVVGSGGVQVYDPKGKSLGSFGRAPETDAVTARFVDRDRLRIYERENDRIVIREADLRARSMRSVGSLPAGNIYGQVAGDRLVLRTESAVTRGAVPVTFSLYDAPSGSRLFAFPAGTRSVMPLTDGTWAVSGDLDGNNVARVSATGEVLSAGRVGAKRVFLGGEVRPGVVSLVELRGEATDEERRLILADSSTWRVLKTIPNLRATAVQSWWRSFDQPGSPAARVFTRDGELYTIDPATLEPKKVELR
ncbi:MAG TPA: hypothetical protein VGF40_12480, partial [Thermoanaerobaculia bacterium]